MGFGHIVKKRQLARVLWGKRAYLRTIDKKRQDYIAYLHQQMKIHWWEHKLAEARGLIK